MPDLLAELAGRTAELRPEELAGVARVPETSPGGDGAGGQVRQVWIGEIPADAVHPPLADAVPDGIILPVGRACTPGPGGACQRRRRLDPHALLRLRPSGGSSPAAAFAACAASVAPAIPAVLNGLFQVDLGPTS